MFKINHSAVVAAGLAAFVMSSLYYGPLLLGNVWRALDPSPTANMTPSTGKLVGEIGRTLAISCLVARLIALLGAPTGKVRSVLHFGCGLGFQR
jgi:Protein of unknown function (DUF1761)